MDNKGGIFTSVVKKKERRSNFNLSHDVKLSLDMGKLIPIYVQDCVPGDHIRINTSTMLRMAPLISPVMHKINVYLEYFFVPNRILWSNWETFITGSRNGKPLAAGDEPKLPWVYPYSENFLTGRSTLGDYMGLPQPEDFDEGQEPDSLIPVSALPFAAYQKIWDEYYRDENLVTSMYDVLDEIEPPARRMVDYDKIPDAGISGAISQQLSQLRPRAWEHDYFTSALPWAQKGEIVSIPVDTGNFSLGIKENPTASLIKTAAGVNLKDDGFPDSRLTYQSPLGNDSAHMYARGETSNAQDSVYVDNTGALEITSSGGEAGGITINDLRAAVRLQAWLETNARGGSRYFESIYAHFGVKSPDSRLQRPEFIGSHRSHMVISEVLQTSSPQSETDTPQGNMSGHGQQVGSSPNFSYYCQEHGYIIGLLSVLPKTAYQQGIPKHFLKAEKLEFYFPEFAHLGEQEIKNIELYAGGQTWEELNETFGYIPRYSEYKFMNSRVCGDFRDTLRFWHMGRVFENPPALNDTFISSDPTKRIFAVQDLPNDGQTGGSIRDYDSIYAHVFHDVKASRLMPKYGTPHL